MGIPKIPPFTPLRLSLRFSRLSVADRALRAPVILRLKSFLGYVQKESPLGLGLTIAQMDRSSGNVTKWSPYTLPGGRCMSYFEKRYPVWYYFSHNMYLLIDLMLEYSAATLARVQFSESYY